MTRWLAALAAVVVFNLTCLVTEPLVPADVVQIDTNSQPTHVITRASEAAALWESHGVEFRFDDVGNVILHDISEHAGDGLISAYWYDSVTGESHVYINQDTYPINGVCLTARALGYAIGLGTVESDVPALMDVGWGIRYDEPCPWSEADAEALCLVRNLCP